MSRTDKKHAALRRRKIRIRKKIEGTAERPRLAVFRSNSHISAQLIDDGAGRTLASASTYEKSVSADVKSTSSVEAAAAVGKLMGARASDAGLKSAVFDRGGNKYHGRIAALADAAREQGLEI